MSDNFYRNRFVLWPIPQMSGVSRNRWKLIMSWWWGISIIQALKTFDNVSDLTSDWWQNIIENRGWLWVSWWLLYPISSWNDCTWALLFDAGKKVPYFELTARIYLQWSSRWGSQYIQCFWWDLVEYNAVNRTYMPWRYCNQVTQSWYTWPSWLWNWVSAYAVITSPSWWHNWWFKYKMTCDNWKYVVTITNDSDVVQRTASFTAWLPQKFRIWLRYWFEFQNYNRCDWMQLKYWF